MDKRTSLVQYLVNRRDHINELASLDIEILPAYHRDFLRICNFIDEFPHDVPFDFTNLPKEYLTALWFLLLHDMADISISDVAISLINRLMSVDLCNSVFFMECVDRLICLLTEFCEDTIVMSPLVITKKPLVLNSAATCLDRIASILEKPQSWKQLAKTTDLTFLPFAFDAINLILNHKYENWSLLNFAANALKNIKSNRNLGEFQDIRNTCKKLIHFLIITCNEGGYEVSHISKLFAFLIKFNGVDDTTNVVNSLLQDAFDISPTVHISVRHTLITSLFPLTHAKKLLTDVVPTESEIQQFFDKLKRDQFDAKTLSIAFNIYAKLFEFFTGNHDTLLSLLSLPWICDTNWSVWADFQKHLPLLKSIKDNEEKFKGLLNTTTLKIFSLKAIARIPTKNEWRSQIFRDALNSPVIPVQIAALEALPYFYSSIPTYPFTETLTPMVESLFKKKLSETNETLSLVQALIRSISLCLCIAGRSYSISTESTEAEIECKICKHQQGAKRTISLKFPPAFIPFLTKIVKIEEEENELKIDCVGLLCSIVRHVQLNPDELEAFIRLSLPMVRAGGGIAASYIYFVEEIAQLNLSQSLWYEIFERHFEIKDELLQVEYFAKYGIHSIDSSYASKFLCHVILAAVVRTTRAPKIIEIAKSMIRTLSEREKVSPRVFFVRNSMKIVAGTIECLLHLITKVLKEAAPSSEEYEHRVNTVIEHYCSTMATIFSVTKSRDNMDLMKAWLDLAVPVVLPALFAYKQEDFKSFELVLKWILNVTKKPIKLLISTSLPQIFWYLCSYRKIRWNDCYMIRINKFANLEELIRRECFKCTVTILLALGKNEAICQSYLKKISEVVYGKVFTYTESVRSFYLGILLGIRRSFTDDLYYHSRHDIIKSLAILINNLESDFISQTARLMITVLKAIVPPDASIEVWLIFLHKLVPATLEELLQPILIAVTPLEQYSGFNRIIEFIFRARSKADPKNDCCKRFDRAVTVIFNNERRASLKSYTSVVNETFLEICAKMLSEESSDVQALVLPKLLQMYDKMELDFKIVNELMHALLHALKTSSKESRNLIGIVIGKIGAVDPGRLGIAAVGDNSCEHVDRRPNPMKFVADLNHFFVDVLELLARLLVECTDAEKIDFIAVSLQNILKELGSPDLPHVQKDVMKNLKPETLREIEPYKTTSFTATLRTKPSITKKPFIDDAENYDEWLWRWYFAASEKIREPRIGRILTSLQYIYYSGDSRLPRQILPQIVLQSLIENNNTVTDEALVEIFGVFKKALTCDGWVRLAAQTCFHVIEFIEKFEVVRMKSSLNMNSEKDRVRQFLSKAVSQLHEERSGELLSVAVAEKYSSSCRALRWLEQYGIKVSQTGMEFNRDAMYALERIYYQLSDTDGVLGAYEVIQINTTPSSRERVVAFEATGNYNEALPLYEQKPVQKLPLVKCLIQLNQPLVASSLAATFASEETDEKVKKKLRDYQIEAAYRRGHWETLNGILKLTNDEENQLTSWGAHISSIFAGIQDQSKQTFEYRIEQARMQVMDSLKAVTMEDSDTYSQAYRYVQRLHILSEIEDAADMLTLFHPKSNKNYEKLIEKWEIRSKDAIQVSSVLEPIYWVRQELLHFANPTQNKDKICKYVLENCKLTRQAGHLSTSWTHLVNARSLGVEKTLSIDMEEARYLFQKGQKGDAIISLQNSLEKYFPTLVKSVNELAKDASDEVIQKASQKAVLAAKLESSELSEYVNSELELLSFIDKENAADITEIYRRYLFVRHLDDISEQQRYSLAVFYDNAYYGRNVDDLGNVKRLIKFYGRVLDSGNRFEMHVMPRMLTIWLDYGDLIHNKKAKEAKEQSENINVANHGRHSTRKNQGKRSNMPVQPPPSSMAASLDAGLHQVTEIVVGLSEKHLYCFLKAFPQLISRICHPSELVSKALVNIISELMFQYPHECLWKSIACFRTKEKEDPIRVRRIKEAYTAASGKARQANRNNSFDKLIENYEKVAALLIEVAEEGDKHCKAGDFHNFNQKFYALSEFFKKKDVNITIPFIEMSEKRMPTFLASQIAIPDDSQNKSVFIRGFENHYKVFSSLARPKQITMIGSDGKRYSLLAKRSDELRKDARCMDFCRMVNNFLLRDPEARRRQLQIRTYSVIPLQAKGGIIEMVPNLTALRAAITPLHSDYIMKKYNESKGSAERKQKWYKEATEKNPPQMANYLRKAFVDPCKWYGARLAYCRTAATISMVGFILGLGDRHLENILIDCANGDLVHVDFNVLFNSGENLPTPEVVPFRLTRNIIDGFGPTGVEGSFRKSCEAVMRVLRKEKDTLSTVLQTFVHDPLLEFSKIDGRNQQMRTSTIKTPVAEQSGYEEIQRIKQRLEGYIVTCKLHPFTKSSIPMSVEAQVAQLIRMAADPNLLCEMFIGWNPHI